MESLESIEKLNEMQILKYFRNQVPPNVEHGGKFSDPYFLPNDSALHSEQYRNGQLLKEQTEFVNNEIKLEKIEWKRITEIFGESSFDVFQDVIEVKDIKQGSLSDCYFLSALASLTEFPDYIYQRFITQEPNKEGLYIMTFFIDGEWQRVFVDDYFPVECGTNNLAFTQTNGTEIWTILLEKAWAKINGGYSNIVLGHVSDAFQALTGFPIEHFPNIQALKKSELWSNLVNADSTDFIMCTGTKNEGFVEEQGLIKGHAYSLVSAKDKDHNGNIVQLVKLFNPWGRREWTGAWSDNSPLWDKEIAAYYGKKENEDDNDGMFFIDINDYLNYYESLYICHLMYGSILRSFYISKEYSAKPMMFKVLLQEDSKIAFSVFFKHWRFHRELTDVNRPFSFMFTKINKRGNPESIDGDFSLGSDIQLVRDLPAGVYLIWMYSANSEIENDYIFRISSEKKIEPCFLGEDVGYKTLENILVANKRITNENDYAGRKDMTIDYDFNLKKVGILAYIGINYSKRSMETKITLNKDDKNLKVLPTYENSPVYNTDPNFGFALPAIRCTVLDEQFKVMTKRQPRKNNANNITIQADAALKSIFDCTAEQTIPFYNTLFAFPQKEELQITRKFRKMGEKIIEKYEFKHFKEVDSFIADKILKLFESNKIDITQVPLIIYEEAAGKYMGMDKTAVVKGATYYGAKFYELTKEVYVGAMQRGKPNGFGVIYKDYKTLFKGYFKEGFKHGKGSFSSEDFFYEGIMFREKFKGLTKIFNKMTNTLTLAMMDSGVKHGYCIEVEYPRMGSKIAIYKKGNLYKEKAFGFKELSFLLENPMGYKQEDWEENFNYHCRKLFPHDFTMNIMEIIQTQISDRAKVKVESQLLHDMAHQFWRNLLIFHPLPDEDYGKVWQVDNKCGEETILWNHQIHLFNYHDIYRFKEGDHDFWLVKPNGDLLCKAYSVENNDLPKFGTIYSDQGKHIIFNNSTKNAIIFIPGKGYYSGTYDVDKNKLVGAVRYSPIDDNFVYLLNFDENGNITLKGTKTKEAIEGEVLKMYKFNKDELKTTAKSLMINSFPYLHVLPEDNSFKDILAFKMTISNEMAAYRMQDDKEHILMKFKDCYGESLVYKKVVENKWVGMKTLSSPYIFKVFGEMQSIQPSGRVFYDNNEYVEHNVMVDFHRHYLCYEKKVEEEEIVCLCYWYQFNTKLAEIIDHPFVSNQEKQSKELLYNSFGDKYRFELDLLFASYESQVDLHFESQYLLDGLYMGQVSPVGLPHGMGVLIYNNHSYHQGAFYIGNWMGGLKHGEGVYVNKKKTHFCGVISYVDEFSTENENIPRLILDILSNSRYTRLTYQEIFFNRSNEQKSSPEQFSLNDIKDLISSILKVREILWDLKSKFLA